MKLSVFAIHRPIFTIMVVLIVILIGSVSFINLPIDLMPEITYPTLSISAQYSNASAREMEQLVTRPIEEAMSAVPGVEEITSTSSEGSSSIRMSFTWGTDLNEASNDIRDRLDRVIQRLPEDMERPSLRKFDPSNFPILTIGVSSNLDPVQLRMLIENQIKYRIERLPGVASLDVRGGLNREIQVNLDADKIKALGLPMNMILNQIRSENVNVPAGNIERGNYNILIRTPGEYSNIEEIRNTIIAMREGVPVQLKEVASVEDSWERVTRIVKINGEPGIQMSVNKQSGKNTVEVAKGVLEEIENINRDMPQIKIIPINDTSGYIKNSITNVGSMAFYGGFLGIFILLFFLRNIRSTLIIATAIPVSIIATFSLMYFSGFTLNLMSLGGLALGIGMLMDSSIVVLENIFRHRESGKGNEAAAIDGSDEVINAIIASTLTTVAVFLPLVFVKGMAGVMFKQLSIIVGFSLLCSLAVAITIVPMLATKILSKESNVHKTSENKYLTKFFNISGNFLNQLQNKYKELLHYCLKHRLLVGGSIVLLLLVSLSLIPLIGVEFMPQADEGEVSVSAEMDVGTRVQVLDGKLDMIRQIVWEAVPEVKSMITSAGGGGMGRMGAGGHNGNIRIALVSQSERRRSSEEIAADLVRRLQNIPGMIIRTRVGQGLFMFRRMTGGTERVQIEIHGHDLNVSDALAERVRREVEQVRGVTDVRISRESGNPEEQIIIDRQKAANMKLTVSQIATTLQTILTGTQASYYKEGGYEYRIRVQVKDGYRMDLNELLDIILTNSDGQPVVLRNVVQVRADTGPVLIERIDRERVANVSANISGRDMGSVITDAKERLKNVAVPRDFSIVFGGDYEEQQKAFWELVLSLILALILVYMVMACQYESLRDPLVVIFSVPFAAIGVILMLFITHTTFNVQSFIGCIMLGGIVVNNAILLVDHTNLLQRRDKMPLFEAIEEAGRRRIRPILMTSFTTMLGLTPLALGMGEGGEAQAPLARAVVGGLMSSTFITLLFVPIVYSLFKERAAKRKNNQ